jgi:hypothetical protein
VIAHYIFAGITGLSCVYPLFFAFGRRGSPLAMAVGLVVFLGAGAEVLVAWALGRCKRWAYVTGVLLVFGLLLFWTYFIVCAVAELIDGGGVGLEGIHWFMFSICCLAVPLSAAIQVLSFRSPTRAWVRTGANPACSPARKAAGEPQTRRRSG